MISDVAKIELMKYVEENLSTGKLGTSTQAPSASDTDLISEVTSTIETVTGSQAGKQITITYNLNSVSGNGNTYSEYCNFFGTSDVMLNRITFTGVPKNSAIEFQVSTIINIV